MDFSAIPKDPFFPVLQIHTAAPLPILKRPAPGYCIGFSRHLLYSSSPVPFSPREVYASCRQFRFSSSSSVMNSYIRRSQRRRLENHN